MRYFLSVFGAFLLSNLTSQNCIPISSNTSSSVSVTSSVTPPSVCTPPLPAGPKDAFLDQYIPNNPAMPVLQFRVNFIIVNHPTIPTIFTGIPQSQIIADANNLVNMMNVWFQTCGSIPSNVPPSNPGPSVPNPKIQLVLNNVYFKTSSTLGAANLFHSPALYNAFPDDAQHTFNIYYYTDTDPGNGGSGWADWGKYAAMAMYEPSIGGPYVTGTISNNPRLLWHELGHGLGFFGDHYGSVMPNNNDPITKNYIPDDATVDNGLGPYSCTAPTGPGTPSNANNNIMGNSGCREVLSARQIAAFHYLVAANMTKKYTQFNGQAYPYSPVYANQSIITLTGTQVISSLGNNNEFDLITIQAGSDITFQNMYLLARPGAKIIVEPGARLTLNCTSVSSLIANAEQWNGIEVWGNASQAQTPADQGYLIITSSEISGARTGISVGMRTSPASFATGTGGGVVEANDLYCYGNEVDVAFSPYVRYSRQYVNAYTTGFGPIDNLSFFQNSSFFSS
ncbi:MAG: hypothetical protein ACRC3B_06740, partial [Bacteroidia bacterium]